VRTSRSGAAMYLTMPIELIHSFVSSSNGTGLITNKSPLPSFMILALPPTLAPKRRKGFVRAHIWPGTTSLGMALNDIFSESGTDLKWLRHVVRVASFPHFIVFPLSHRESHSPSLMMINKISWQIRIPNCWYSCRSNLHKGPPQEDWKRNQEPQFVRNGLRGRVNKRVHLDYTDSIYNPGSTQDVRFS
jgi:hypothetical protein